MTGYGLLERELDGRKVTIEIKSLNSKNADISVRLPHFFREAEFDVRKILSEKLVRGKVDVWVREEMMDTANVSFNKEKIHAYITALGEMVPESSADARLKVAFVLPDVIEKKENVLEESAKNAFLKMMEEAADKVTAFRRTEGNVLYEDLHRSVTAIEDQLNTLSQYEGERLAAVKEKLQKGLESLGQADETRYYQEIVYYTEKLDISEEKTRLAQHTDFFKTEMESYASGKKLGFIAQEMGREINTIGSKASHAGIQKCVVEMKDHLERIKEQVLNVL